MRFYDLDWHIIEIEETMESVVKRLFNMGQTMDEICEKSSMPVEFVEYVINTLAK